MHLALSFFALSATLGILDLLGIPHTLTGVFACFGLSIAALVVITLLGGRQ